MKLHKLCALLVISSITTNATTLRDGLSFGGKQKLYDIISLIRENHFKNITEEQVIESATSAILSSLDKYSYFYNKQAFKELDTYTSGEFCGIGVEIKVDEGRAVIISLVPEGPAAMSGIKPMDRIIAIDNQNIAGMRQQAILNSLIGKPETKVVVTVMRKGKQIVFPLLRKKITLSPIEYKFLPKGVIYLKVGAFYDNTMALVEQACQKFKTLQDQNKIKGFILDLRDNPGGKLEQAINIASIFIRSGLIVKVVSSQENVDYEAIGNPSFRLSTTIPMVVMINKGTASAAEVLAAALQDHKRAFLIGEKSFGKGSVQALFSLKDGDAISMTTGLYYTPSGRSIEGSGLTPDIQVNKNKKVTLKEINSSANIDYAIKLASMMMYEKHDKKS